MGTAPLYSVEALGTHERLSFSCGVPELDQYLHVQAGQDAKRKVAAPFVMVDSGRNVVGYYTLSSYCTTSSCRCWSIPESSSSRWVPSKRRSRD